jgi:hypothetical protein
LANRQSAGHPRPIAQVDAAGVMRLRRFRARGQGVAMARWGWLVAIWILLAPALARAVEIRVMVSGGPTAAYKLSFFADAGSPIWSRNLFDQRQ